LKHEGVHSMKISGEFLLGMPFITLQKLFLCLFPPITKDHYSKIN